MRRVLFILALFGFAAPAAASLTVQPNDLVNDPQALTDLNNNDFRVQLDTLGYKQIFNQGANVKINQAGTLTFYYHGAESGYSNMFVVGGTFTESGTKYTDGSGTVLKTEPVDNNLWEGTEGTQIGTLQVNGTETFSELGIGFAVYEKGTAGGTPKDALAGTAGFGVIFKSDTGWIDVNELFIGFDDNGAGPDDNHDDMIIRVTFTPAPVPEATTIVVWSVLGLIGVTAYRRRQLA